MRRGAGVDDQVGSSRALQRDVGELDRAVVGVLLGAAIRALEHDDRRGADRRCDAARCRDVCRDIVAHPGPEDPLSTKLLPTCQCAIS